MVTVLTAIHVIAAIFMILVVLLQAGKGAGMGSAFGGAASQASFGGGGGGLSLLGKITAGVAVVFMLTSMSLAYISSRKVSLVDTYVPPTPAPTAIEDLGVFDAPPTPVEQLPVIPQDEIPVEGAPVEGEPVEGEPTEDAAPVESETLVE